MKKTVLFIFSVTVALGITSYIRGQRNLAESSKSSEWKTFVKKGGSKITSHPTTAVEYKEAQIRHTGEEKHSRAPASIKAANPYKGFLVRKNRILTGEIDQKYEDDSEELNMVNAINPDWKEIMGSQLMKFQPEDTKVLVKDEISVIDIDEGKGRYLEQVIITYVSKNGDRSSFKALVDSDTGSIIETWDRTISERKIRSGLKIPAVNDSGVTAR